MSMEPDWKPQYERWRHGGWYVVNIHYPSGAVGCVSRNYADRKWRVVCDDRRKGVGQPGDITFSDRDAAARGELEYVRQIEASLRADGKSSFRVHYTFRDRGYCETQWAANADDAALAVLSRLEGAVITWVDSSEHDRGLEA